MENKYYVYVWIREDNNSVFYVGKGSGKRAMNKTVRKEHFKRIVNKIPCHYEIIKDKLTESEAYELEKETIKYYLDLGYGIDIKGYERTSEFYLVNSTLGGDGTNGYKWEDGSRIGEKNNFYGKHHTEETKELLRQYHLGTKASEETKQKLSDMRKGEGNNMYGKRGELSPIYGTHRTEEEKMKQREALGTEVYCIELRKRFPSLSYAAKYMKENYGLKVNKDTIKANCLGKTKKDWYGEIEINGVMTKLHWTFEKINTYND